MGGIIGIGPRVADAIAKGIIFNTTMENNTKAGLLIKGATAKVVPVSGAGAERRRYNTWAHSIDLTKIASTKPPIFTDFFIGFISIFVFSYIIGAIFTGIYNAIVKRIG